MKASAAPERTPWLWTLAYGQYEDRTPTQGYEATREAARRRLRKAGPAAAAGRWARRIFAKKCLKIKKFDRRRARVSAP
jgi:hypothetical protein